MAVSFDCSVLLLLLLILGVGAHPLMWNRGDLIDLDVEIADLLKRSAEAKKDLEDINNSVKSAVSVNRPYQFWG